MRIVDQATMNRLFEVTDQVGIDREQLQVPLAMEGEGRVRRLEGGAVEITLPDTEDLDPFLEGLPAKLRRL